MNREIYFPANTIHNPQSCLHSSSILLPSSDRGKSHVCTAGAGRGGAGRGQAGGTRRLLSQGGRTRGHVLGRTRGTRLEAGTGRRSLLVIPLPHPRILLVLLRHPDIIKQVTIHVIVQSRAGNEGSRRFHNHEGGPYLRKAFSWMKA